MQALKEEKIRIANAEVELLEKIKQNWLALKCNLSSKQIANVRSENMEQNQSGIYNQSILEKSLTYTLVLLAEKLAIKLNEKLSSIRKK